MRRLTSTRDPIETMRRLQRRERTMLCGGIAGGPPAAEQLLGGGLTSLVPAAMLGLLVLAAASVMVRRWGGRPPVLPAGETPAPRPRRDERREDAQAPAALPAPA